MDFSEFKRRLGAEPRGTDPEFVAARDSSPEHREAAIRAAQFEDRLEKAVDVPIPPDLVASLLALPAGARRPPRRWMPMALAAGLLIAIGAAGMGWKMNHRWDSVEDYVVDHYRHDGAKVLAMAADGPRGDVHAMLAELGLDARPELANIVRLVKFCPTPGGKGVHMVLATKTGPVTVIYMPETSVDDHNRLSFDDLQVMLVNLESGSAAIIAEINQPVQDYYAVVHDSIFPLTVRS